jgi:proteic killer suppression protein
MSGQAECLVIASFMHKGLRELFERDATAKIDRKMHERIKRRLDAIDRARRPQDLDVPGFDFHGLKGFNPSRYSVHVNGPWCITFEFNGENACRVDFEQYH